MKISHNWLKRLINIPEEPAEVAKWLTGMGLEVEGIEQVEKIPGSLAGLVIGEVLSCEKHPDADKLKVTRVQAGTGTELQIVCGAPNVAAGQKVVVALEGAWLNPVEGQRFQIKKSKIRGVFSEGMLCAEDEIGLGKSHDGIMVLDTTLANGSPACDHFNLAPEPVYEIGLTPNRVDAASHLGVARDIRALTGRAVQMPEIFKFSGEASGPVSIHLENEACGRYAGLLIENVRIMPSPDWMQNLLRSIGINPKNNVVDITNFVLHELGQPLHAFDASRIGGQKIVVRKAIEGEKIRLLDQSEKNLSGDDLIIADAGKPLALAGIMGGADAAVTEETKNIFLESAWFDPASIRKSAQRHGLKTDSSFRFERGCDLEMAMTALARAAWLLMKCGSADTITFLPMDQRLKEPEEWKIRVRWRNIHRLIGMEIEREAVLTILHRLEIRTKPIEEYGHEGFEEEFEAFVPPYRVDVQREADLVEEILRVYGIDNIPIGGPLSAGFISPGIDDLAEQRTNRAASLLADMGYSEIIQNSLENANLYDGLEEYPVAGSIPLLNRLSEDLGFMRQSLLFSGLEALAYNLNRRQNDLRFFEFGKIYRKKEVHQEEKHALSIMFCGNWPAVSWENPGTKAGYFHLKKTMENLLERLGFSGLQWRNETHSFYAYGQTLYFQNKIAGWAGLLKEDISRRKEVKQPVFFAQLDWELFRKAKSPRLKVSDVPRFPAVNRDLSVVIDQKTRFEEIERILRGVNRKLIREVSVFDVYEGNKIESGKKAYAMTILLQDEEQTLTDQKVDSVMNSVMEKLEKEVGAQIRR